MAKYGYVYGISQMKTKKQTADPLISGPRVARTIDVDPATVRRWVGKGMPCRILGEGLVRYRLNEVLAWRALRKNK
jgi:hypothetical protein